MMPCSEHVAIPLAGICAVDTRESASVDLGALGGVNVLVLLRHRH